MNQSTPYDPAMRQAIELARCYTGATAPNPPVGAALLDAAGNILASAAHAKAGEAHAEAKVLLDYIELRAAGAVPEAHSLVVTLEPCNHTGHTPPCTQAIIKSGIKTVVFGTEDPNTAVQGGGAEFLRQQGITVIEGVLNEECRQLITYFTYAKTTKRPWITIKRAFSKTNCMIPPAGQKTFTTEQALRTAHRIRKSADAILTGAGTVLADRPLFTVRHVSDHPHKQRLLIIATHHPTPSLQNYKQCAEKNGFEVMFCDDIPTLLSELYRRDIHHLLVEAGPKLSGYMLNEGLWNLAMTFHEGVDEPICKLNDSGFVPFDSRANYLDTLLPHDQS